MGVNIETKSYPELLGDLEKKLGEFMPKDRLGYVTMIATSLNSLQTVAESMNLWYKNIPTLNLLSEDDLLSVAEPLRTHVLNVIGCVKGFQQKKLDELNKLVETDSLNNSSMKDYMR
jgi:hypothetical protein